MPFNLGCDFFGICPQLSNTTGVCGHPQTVGIQSYQQPPKP